jgi:hypothetical protein
VGTMSSLVRNPPLINHYSDFPSHSNKADANFFLLVDRKASRSDC